MQRKKNINVGYIQTIKEHKHCELWKMSSNSLLLKLKGKLTWSFFNEHIIIKDNQWGKEPWTNGVLNIYHLLVYVKESNPSRKKIFENTESKWFKEYNSRSRRLWILTTKLNQLSSKSLKQCLIKLISSPKFKSIYLLTFIHSLIQLNINWY